MVEQINRDGRFGLFANPDDPRLIERVGSAEQ
jgi:hypothetical protein